MGCLSRTQEGGTEAKSESGLKKRIPDFFRVVSGSLLRLKNGSCHVCPTKEPSRISMSYLGNNPHGLGLSSTQSRFTDVVLSKSLGSGASGTVYIGTSQDKTVAIKIVDCSVGALEVPEDFISSLRHPHLVEIYDVRKRTSIDRQMSETSSRSSLNWDNCSLESFTQLTKNIPSKHGLSCKSQAVWIMMEYCNLGSLSNLIHQKAFHENGELSKPNVLFILLIMQQVVDAMMYLHKSRVIHSDLKSPNVFLATSQDSPLGFNIKVGDFGTCRKPNKKGLVKTFSLGTVDHMAPEVLRNNEIRFASDVFSFGMLLWECLTGTRPFPGQTPTSILMTIVEGIRPEIPFFIPQDCQSLITDCWQQDWKRRPSFKMIEKRIRTMIKSRSQEVKKLELLRPLFEEYTY